LEITGQGGGQNENIKIDLNGTANTAVVTSSSSLNTFNFSGIGLQESGNAVPNATDNLGFFSATTSAQLSGVLSDETGSGLAVFATSPTFTTGITTPKVIWTGSVQDLTGSGSPESSVTAPIGSVYRRTDGGSGTVLYVKESGSGNTGWIAYGSPAGSGAPTTAAYWTAQAEGGLSAEVNLGALTTGLLKHTVSGVFRTPATATAGTDYVVPSTAVQFTRVGAGAAADSVLEYLAEADGIGTAITHGMLLRNATAALSALSNILLQYSLKVAGGRPPLRLQARRWNSANTSNQFKARQIQRETSMWITG
jgi:hypothetical protein